MKDEIKEILDRLERIDHKEYSCGFEFADSGTFDEDCRCFEERKKLANYITNLQEENEKLKELKYEFIDNCGDNESFTLENYLEIGNKLYDCEEQLQDYKSRNEKAIEYIENEMPYLEEPDDDYENNHKMIEYDRSILLNILQEEDKK